MSQFMENENRLRNWAIANEKAAQNQARAMSEDYREMHDLRPAHPVKREYGGWPIIPLALFMLSAILALVGFYWIVRAFLEVLS